MAKKKTETPAKIEKTWESKPVAFQVRGSLEYKAAIEEFAEACGFSIAAIVDQALRTHARAVGYTKPIPKR